MDKEIKIGLALSGENYESYSFSFGNIKMAG